MPTATIRQQLIELLSENEYDARDLSQQLGVRETVVYEHIPHITRSVNTMGKKLKIIPSRCAACGYTFKDRKRPAKPSRCPTCKSERIEKPRFYIA